MRRIFITLSLLCAACSGPNVRSSIRPADDPRLPGTRVHVRLEPAASAERVARTPVAMLPVRFETRPLAAPDPSFLRTLGARPDRGRGGLPQAPPSSTVELSGWTFHFGAGEAPYDDGLHSVDLMPESPRGFSDTVLRMGYGGRLARDLAWSSDITALRNQDEPILTGLDNTELGWVTFGLHFRF